MLHILTELPDGVDRDTTITLSPSLDVGRWRVQVPDPTSGAPLDVGVAVAVEVGVLSLAALFPDVATTVRLQAVE